MAEREQVQPQVVSEPLANYLDMTAPRERVPRDRPRRRAEQEKKTRPLLDNFGLGLEEGNDFA